RRARRSRPGRLRGRLGHGRGVGSRNGRATQRDVPGDPRRPGGRRFARRDHARLRRRLGGTYREVGDRMLTLVVDTSTPAVTAAVASITDDGVTVTPRVLVDQRAHGEMLTPLLLAALAEAGADIGDV